MNSFNYLLFFILTIILIIMSLTSYVYREPFVPRKIREIYRPISRNVRNNYEGFYDKSSTHISNFFRKFGIF
jgi:hypothetical protein